MSSELIRFMDKLEARVLSAESAGMNFFRCQSNLYPYVESFIGPLDETLTLRFYGHEKASSSVL